MMVIDDPALPRVLAAIDAVDLPAGRRLALDAELGAALRLALDAAGTLILSAGEDVFSVSVPPGRCFAAVASRRSALAALRAVMGGELQRMCGRCGERKADSHFSTAARYCKACERRRVKEYEVARALEGRALWDVTLPGRRARRFAGATKSEVRASAKAALGLDRLPPGTQVTLAPASAGQAPPAA